MGYGLQSLQILVRVDGEWIDQAHVGGIWGIHAYGGGALCGGTGNVVNEAAHMLYEILQHQLCIKCAIQH